MFKVGQKVVCKKIDPSNNGKLKPDYIYIVSAIANCECEEEFLILKELSGLSTYCVKCGYVTGRPAFSSWRFEPLVFKKADYKKLIEEIIEERIDVPIKEPV